MNHNPNDTGGFVDEGKDGVEIAYGGRSSVLCVA
jgi:hypothetical protein